MTYMNVKIEIMAADIKQTESDSVGVKMSTLKKSSNEKSDRYFINFFQERNF